MNPSIGKEIAESRWLTLLSRSAEGMTYVCLFLLFTRSAVEGPVVSVALVLAVTLLIARRNRAVLGSWVARWFGIYLLAVFAIIPFSVDPLYSLRETVRQTVPGVALFCLVVSWCSDVTSLRRLMFGMIIVNMYLTAVAYKRFLTELITQGYDATAPYSLALKPGYNLNSFAVRENTAIPFLVVALAQARGKKSRLMLSVSLAAAVAAVLLSLSRLGWGGLFVMAAIGLIACIRLPAYRKAGLTGAVVFIVLMSLLFSLPQMRRMLVRTQTEIEHVNYRTDIWTHVLPRVAERPAAGWGAGTEIFRRIVIPEDAVPAIRPVENAHNTFLSILFHQGAVVLACYIAVLIATVVRMVRTVERAGGDFLRDMAFATAAAVIGNFIVSGSAQVTSFQLVGLIAGLGASLDACCSFGRGVSSV